MPRPIPLALLVALGLTAAACAPLPTPFTRSSQPTPWAKPPPQEFNTVNKLDSGGVMPGTPVPGTQP